VTAALATTSIDRKATAVRRVVVIVLVLNLAVAAAKFVYAAASGSLAVATDAIHSLIDASSNVVGIIALRAAVSPPDAEHPYGHRKIELLAAASIGVLIGVATFEFARSAITALWHHTPAGTVPATGFILVGGTLVVNVFVALYERKQGLALQSGFLVADAAHTASDVVVTFGVLTSFVLVRMGLTWADAACALAVTLVIARVAWRILRDNFDALLDRAVFPADEVHTVAMAVPGITSVHRVRSRGLADAANLDLHLQVDGALPLSRAHDLAHQVESALRARYPGLVDVTIHMEPDDDAEEGL
jgi:cation diffusion facilitator family transporter